MNKTGAVGFADALATSIADAVDAISARPTPGGQDYVAVIRLTHDQRGLVVDGVSVAAGSSLGVPATELMPTFRGTSEHPVDWVDHLPAG